MRSMGIMMGRQARARERPGIQEFKNPGIQELKESEEFKECRQSEDSGLYSGFLGFLGFLLRLTPRRCSRLPRLGCNPARWSLPDTFARGLRPRARPLRVCLPEFLCC